MREKDDPAPSIAVPSTCHNEVAAIAEVVRDFRGALPGAAIHVFANVSSDSSDYRVFARRFVRSFPVLSIGFEIETEITADALESRVPVVATRTPCGERGRRELKTLHYLAQRAPE